MHCSVLPWRRTWVWIFLTTSRRKKRKTLIAHNKGKATIILNFTFLYIKNLHGICSYQWLPPYYTIFFFFYLTKPPIHYTNECTGKLIIHIIWRKSFVTSFMKIYSQRLVISSFARNFFFFDTLLLEILERKFHIYVAGADFEYICYSRRKLQLQLYIMFGL